MHLNRIRIRDFRNLKDFELSLAGTECQFHSYAVIGPNGSGKSNLLEAIVTIFRDLDLNNAASLDYELDYSIRGHNIEIKAQAGTRPAVVIDGRPSSAGKLSEDAREYLPSNVFVYYSGKNERIEQLFQAHQKRFVRRAEITADEFLPTQLLNRYTGQEEQKQAIEEHRQGGATAARATGRGFDAPVVLLPWRP